MWLQEINGIARYIDDDNNIYSTQDIIYKINPPNFMKNLSNIGLDLEKSHALANLLDNLLSNYSIFYQNVRGYHWNIQGEKFFELHLKFEELYNMLFENIDQIAERILTLGHVPEHKFINYLKRSSIEESNNVTNGLKAVEETLGAFKVLLEKQRTILKFSSDINDEGTNAQISDYLREQEKLVWMYSAYLKK